MKINNFRGDLTDVPAKKEALTQVSLLRSHHGALVVLHNLVVLCETITRLLDPACNSRRHRCLFNVVALMNELCMRYPMVAAHNSSSSFAVGCPEIMHPDPRVATVAAQSPITIYDMSTGLKTKVLVLSGRKSAGVSAGVNPLAPLAHVRLPPVPLPVSCHM